jgi:type II secretory ATPase GspE/PulE/Tfp pilus assembly ATPase PilB-like protein
MVVAEILPITHALDVMIASGAPRHQLHETHTVPSLKQQALAKVVAGETSLEEMIRIVGAPHA